MKLRRFTRMCTCLKGGQNEKPTIDRPAPPGGAREVDPAPSTAKLDKWTTEFVIPKHATYLRPLEVLRRGDGLMCIKDPATNTRIFLAINTLKWLGEKIADYEPKTVSGMEALQHILNGGKAYQIRTQTYELENDKVICGGRPAGFCVAMLRATNWVLVH